MKNLFYKIYRKIIKQSKEKDMFQQVVSEQVCNGKGVISENGGDNSGLHNRGNLLPDYMVAQNKSDMKAGKDNKPNLNSINQRSKNYENYQNYLKDMLHQDSFSIRNRKPVSTNGESKYGTTYSQEGFSHSPDDIGTTVSFHPNAPESDPVILFDFKKKYKIFKERYANKDIKDIAEKQREKIDLLNKSEYMKNAIQSDEWNDIQSTRDLVNSHRQLFQAWMILDKMFDTLNGHKGLTMRKMEQLGYAFKKRCQP